jgi:predicted RNA-binding protein with PIN domain
MKHYIIDGNNLIGKIKVIAGIQKKDKQGSRIKIAYKIDNYFADRKAKVTLHFDGFVRESIKMNNVKIVYSDNDTADEKIKKQIESSRNSKLLVVVTSDNNLTQFARVCSCKIISSEEFAKSLKRKNTDNEDSIIEKLEKNSGEFEKLFGVNGD